MINREAAILYGLSILAGVLILFMPKLLNYIVAIYLIVYGIVGLLL
ncbi:MAG TPA: DUF3096 domain-containing protein [Verrucomicrobia bacterium]|nr:DUF3096 domain-containing protein [Verrucomicrobiota bacterium]